MYGSYHDLKIGPYSSRRIPDLFPGILGPVDAAFDDNTYVYIIQGMQYNIVHTTNIYITKIKNVAFNNYTLKFYSYV